VAGELSFFSRVFVQWYATERLEWVVILALFWWLSPFGSLLLFCHAVFHVKDSVFILPYATIWILYLRNFGSYYRALSRDCIS
jgi:lipid-A-disaccharide synthase-like uncharacterized protein